MLGSVSFIEVADDNWERLDFVSNHYHPDCFWITVATNNFTISTEPIKEAQFTKLCTSMSPLRNEHRYAGPL